ncbi:MAG: hypothetical protein GY884_18680, partial [Proteobacteria bacterium]|nr:hypothetical protein [Pseudomonadota bacterium]
EDTPDVVDVTAIDDTFRTFEERIAFLEARADAAEAALAASTSDADNAQLWLQSLTDDVSALQSHASDTDAIVVTTAADLDTLQAAHDAHAQESTAQHAEHDARFDSLDDDVADQAAFDAAFLNDLGTLQSRIAAIVVDIATLDGQTSFELQNLAQVNAAMGSAIQQQMGAMATMELDLKEVVTSLGQQAATVAGNTASIDDSFAAVQIVSNDVASLNQRVDVTETIPAALAAAIEEIGEQVDELEEQALGFVPVEVDMNDTCGVETEYGSWLFERAMDVQPGQVLALDYVDGGMEIIDPEEVICGFTELHVQEPPRAVSWNGDVFLLANPTSEYALTEGTIWTTLAAF